MDIRSEAFIADWMENHTHLFEEIILLQADDPTTKCGAAARAYHQVAAEWSPDHSRVPRDPR